ncbi:MAG: hypothetical protein WCW77_01395 [Patescibacteria group bacterium]|jgi:hypothetical protein
MPNQNENAMRQNVLGNELSGPAQSQLAGRKLKEDQMAGRNKDRISGQMGGSQLGNRPQAGKGTNEGGMSEGLGGAGGGQEADMGGGRNLRQEQARARNAQAQEEEQSNKAAQAAKSGLGKIVLNYFLSAIPGVNIVWAGWRFLRDGKLNLRPGQKIVMAFSSISTFLWVISLISGVAMITGWISNPFKAIVDLGFGSLTALASFFIPFAF